MQKSVETGLSALVAASLVTLLGACASTPTQKSTSEFVDDAALTAKVKTELAESPEVKAHEVNVETYRGVVQLNGFVDTPSARAAATQVASSVSGVKEVRNNLQVAEHTSIEGSADDTMVTAKVKTALITEPMTKAYQIDVTTQQGIVQLAGFVDSPTEKSKATEVARSVPGVKDVRNDLQVKPAP